jgi:hypothetical protein
MTLVTRCSDGNHPLFPSMINLNSCFTETGELNLFTFVYF